MFHYPSLFFVKFSPAAISCRVGATGFSLSSCHRCCLLLHSRRLRELRLQRRRVRNNESIATRRAKSIWTETESSCLGHRTSMLGTWMSLPTLRSLTMVLCVTPLLFIVKFWKTISLIFGFTVKFFFWGFVIILPNS